jgi:hypothetical protein
MTKFNMSYVDRPVDYVSMLISLELVIPHHDAIACQGGARTCYMNEIVILIIGLISKANERKQGNNS